MTNPQRAQLDALYQQGVLSTAEYEAALARLADPSAGMLQPTSAPSAPPLPPPPTKSGMSRNKIAAIVAIAVLVIAAAVALPLILTGGGSSKPNAQSTDSASTSQAAIPSTEVPVSTEEDTPSDPTPTPATSYSVGEALPITSSDDSGTQTASSEVTVLSVRTSKYDSSTDQSPDNGLFVIVKLRVVGETGASSYNPNDFYLSSSDGEHSEDETFTSEYGTPFEQVTVHAGERSTGTIVFDAAPSARKGSVYYSPNSDDNPLAYWAYAAK